MSKRIKSIIVIFSVLAAVLVSFIIVQSLSNRGKIQIKTISAPNDTLIKLNDKKVDDSFYVTPGKYKVSGEKDGFQKYEYEIVVNKGDKTKELFFVLVPEAESALEWVKENQNQYTKVEKQAGEQARKEGEEFSKQNPIVNLLPHDRGYYKIDYGEDPETKKITIQITGDAAGRQVAIENIRQWGYEPTDYKIEFRGFSNMFQVDEETISQ